MMIRTQFLQTMFFCWMGIIVFGQQACWIVFPETDGNGAFQIGLKDDIRLDVKIKQPRALADTIGVAQLVEVRNQLQRWPTPINRMQSGAPLLRVNSNPSAGILGPTPSQRSGMGSNVPPSPSH